MMTPQEDICINEEKINSQAQLNSLDTHVDFKDKRMDEIFLKLERIEEKLDILNDSIINCNIS